VFEPYDRRRPGGIRSSSRPPSPTKPPTRYVLDGRGRVTVDYYDEATGESRRIENRRIYPGTLVEVDGEAKLSWDVDDERTGMIVLTPNYEEGGKLLIVGGFLLVFCAGLLIGSGGV
jgi:hypothetical protein